MSLNEPASAPSSSPETTGTRADRSPALTRRVASSRSLHRRQHGAGHQQGELERHGEGHDHRNDHIQAEVLERCPPVRGEAAHHYAGEHVDQRERAEQLPAQRDARRARRGTRSAARCSCRAPPAEAPPRSRRSAGSPRTRSRPSRRRRTGPRCTPAARARQVANADTGSATNSVGCQKPRVTKVVRQSHGAPPGLDRAQLAALAVHPLGDRPQLTAEAQQSATQGERHAGLRDQQDGPEVPARHVLVERQAADRAERDHERRATRRTGRRPACSARRACGTATPTGVPWP